MSIMSPSSFVALAIVIMINYCNASLSTFETSTSVTLVATSTVASVVANTGWWAYVVATSSSILTGAASMWASFTANAASAAVALGIAALYITAGGIVIAGIWYAYSKFNTKSTIEYTDEQRNVVQYNAIRVNETQKKQILAAKGNIKIECYHVSCKSDHPGKDKKNWYAIGFVLYSYNGQLKWEMNGIRCRSGYIVVISSENVQKVKGETWHNSAFKQIFGKYPRELKQTLIAGGFSVQQGVNVYNSETFNYGPKKKAKYGFAERDSIHFGTRVMNPIEQKYIAHALSNWINKKQQNTKVSSVPKDGDVLCVHPDYVQPMQSQ